MRTLLTLTLSLMLAVPALGAPAATGSSSAKPISAPPASASLLAGALSGGHTAAPVAPLASESLLAGTMTDLNAANPTEASPAAPLSLLNRARDAGMLLAGGPALQNTCDEAVTDGTAAGKDFDTSGWFLGGMFLGIVMPIASSIVKPPSPPEVATQLISDSQVRTCYVEAYGEAAKAKRTNTAWKGLGAWAGLIVGVILLSSLGD